MWSLIVGLIIGGLAGWVASMIMGRNAQMGIVANIVVGIVGALIGGFIMRGFGFSSQGGWFWTFLVALLGAVILLWIINLFTKYSAKK